MPVNRLSIEFLLLSLQRRCGPLLPVQRVRNPVADPLQEGEERLREAHDRFYRCGERSIVRGTDQAIVFVQAVEGREEHASAPAGISAAKPRCPARCPQRRIPQSGTALRARRAAMATASTTTTSTTTKPPAAATFIEAEPAANLRTEARRQPDPRNDTRQGSRSAR